MRPAAAPGNNRNLVILQCVVFKKRMRNFIDRSSLDMFVQSSLQLVDTCDCVSCLNFNRC